MADRSRSQYSHMRSVPGVSIDQVGQGYMVDARVYRSCCLLVVGRGLVIEG